MPLRRDGFSRRKILWHGQLYGIVKPVAGVAGAAALILAQPALPYPLAFAGSAMVLVTIDEMVPEAQRGGNSHLAAIGGMVGFAVMTLHVALG